MKLTRCDRCGKTKEEPQMDPEYYTIHAVPVGGANYDLCGSCRKQLEDFLRPLPVAAEPVGHGG